MAGEREEQIARLHRAAVSRDSLDDNCFRLRLDRSIVAEEVAKFVRENHVTQVIFGRSAQTGWQKYLYLSAIHKFLRDAPPVDVHIVTQEMK